MSAEPPETRRLARRAPAFSYVLAIAATLVTVQIRLTIVPVADDPALLLFMVPIVLSAYWGGLGPGLVSTVVAVAASAYFLLPPAGSFAIGQPFDYLRLAILVVAGGMISGLSGRLRRDRYRAQESERRVSLILEATNEGVRDWNVVTGDVYFSPRWIESLGYRPAEVSPRIEFWESLVHPDDLLPLREQLRRHFAGETTHYEFINRLRKRSGDYRWNLDRGKVVERGADGRPLRMVGTDTDITARRRAVEALRESEERLQTVVENLSEGLVVSDEAGQLLHWNRSGLEIHGFRDLAEGLRHVAQFRDIFELTTLDGTVVPYEDWPLQRVLRGEQLRHLDLRIRRQDFAWERICSYGGTTVHAPGGRRLAILTITDITDRKRAEQELLASEERFRQLAESIREVFWLHDSGQKRLLYVSPAYETIWGRSRDSLYAAPDDWLAAVHPEDRARVDEAARTKETTGVYDEEYRIVRPDGSIRWIRDQGYPVRDASGQVTRFAGVAEDVTERQQLEAQLRQTQKMESIGRLAGGVAHDFNNWLTVISGCTELVAEMLPPDPVAAQLIGEIRHAGERAASLTRQLLAFSRREVLEPRVLDLNAVVTDAEKMLRRILGEDVILSAVLDPAIGRVRIDAGQWIQILMNLAVNARDAMPQGGRLTIETREAELDEGYVKLRPGMARGRYVMLAVSDTGCGMTPEVKARIFDPFFTTKPRGEGTGLGLAVVHGIVEQSGGHISVYSEPGVGTTFKFYLPPVGAGTDAPTGPELAARMRGTETILLVEDEDSVRRVTSRILQRYGYSVLEAAGGEAALRLLEQEQARVALLLTDVVMPNMDGRQLAERVQANYPHVKILYTSGYTDDAVVRHGILHAEVAFIQKPHSALMLVSKIREVLDRR